MTDHSSDSFIRSSSGEPLSEEHVVDERLLAAIASDVPPGWRDLAPAQIEHMVAATLATVASRPVREVLPRRRMMWRPVIAGCTALAVAGTVFFISRASIRTEGTLSPRMYVTEAGQRALLTLEDGSQVTLAPLTRLTVDAGFRKDNRAVQVQGSAHFRIVTAQRAPFVVRANGIRTQVLGTEFTVTTDPEDHTVQVAVAAGKVAVGKVAVGRDNGKRAIVAAGHVAVADDSSITVTATPNTESLMSWADGRLKFERTPLPDALTTLGRWYRVEFQLADSSLAARDMTGTIAVGSVADMLTTLRNLLGVSMSYEPRADGVMRITLRQSHAGGATPKRGGQKTSDIGVGR